MAATFNAEPLPTQAVRQASNTRPDAASAGGAVTAGGVAAASEVTAHLSATDPHPQYETAAETAAAIAAHVALTDPHSQYLTQTEGDARYVQDAAIDGGQPDAVFLAAQAFDGGAP